MFEEKFGLLPKKKVTFDGNDLIIKKEIIPAHQIKIIYKRPFNLSVNEWGSLYISIDGNDLSGLNPLNKQLIQFSNKQEEKIDELLSQLDVEVINKPNFSSASVTGGKLNKNIIIKCPNCSSTDLENLGNNKKTFSVGKAAAGGLLTGGIDTLAGFASKKGKTDKWHCKEYGNVFDK